jgi:hypothetical protein
MGAGSSLPSSGRLKEEQTQELITKIMRLMLSKTNIVDLYSLSDPTKCKEYVVATKDALQKLFSEIKVYPEKGKDGVFYFQRIKGLRLRSEDVDQQETRCKDLAFFYVRIFQIFAALALTIFDSIPRDVYLKGKVGEGAAGLGRRLAFGDKAPGFAGQRGGVSHTPGTSPYIPIKNSKFPDLLDIFQYIPGYGSGIEADIIPQLLIQKENNTARASKKPLIFSGYSLLKDGFENGLLTIDQDTIYRFGKDIKPGSAKSVTFANQKHKDSAAARPAVKEEAAKAAAAPPAASQAAAAASPAASQAAAAASPAASQAAAAASPAASQAAAAASQVARPVALSPAAAQAAATARDAAAAQAAATARDAAAAQAAATARDAAGTPLGIGSSGTAFRRPPASRQGSGTQPASRQGSGTPGPGAGSPVPGAGSPVPLVGAEGATAARGRSLSATFGGGGEYKIFDTPPRSFKKFEDEIKSVYVLLDDLEKEQERKPNPATFKKIGELKNEISYARYRKYDDRFEPRIKYSFTINNTEKWIEATFTFYKETSNSRFINITATSIKSNSSVTFPRSKSSMVEESKIQEGLVKFMIDLYKSDNPLYSFSIIKFLENTRLANTSRADPNDTIRILDTNIFIDSPGDVRYLNKVPIYFRGRIRTAKDNTSRRGDDIRDVKIYADLYMEMERTSGQIEYRTRVSFAGYESENPSGFRFPERAIIKTFVATSSNEEPRIQSDSYKTFRKELQKIFMNILEKRSTDYGDYDDTKYTKDGMPVPYDSDRMEQEFKVKTYWDALRQDPPVKAHCVARALQLLNADAIYGTKSERATSHVCDIKFSLIQNRSLPDPTKSITSSAGISVLVNLFFDKLMAQTQAIQDRVDYDEKVAVLRRHFGRVESEERGAAGGTEVSAVKEYLPPFCDSGRGGTIGEFEVRGRRDIDELRDRARALLNRQVKHIGRAVAIIFKLFDEGALKRNDFAFHPRIQAGGITAVNQVAKEARDLLIEYYSDCEDIYKDGLIYLNRAVTRARRDQPQSLAKRFSMSGPAAAAAPAKEDEPARPRLVNVINPYAEPRRRRDRDDDNDDNDYYRRSVR